MYRKVGLIAILLMASMPVAQSQEENGQTAAFDTWFRLGEDATGDNPIQLLGQAPQESPFDPADLLALDIKETSDSLWFRVNLAGMTHQDSIWTVNGNEILDASYYSYDVYFDGMDHSWRVDVDYYVDGEGNQDTYAYLHAVYQDDNTYWSSYMGDLTIGADNANNALVVEVPRDMLLDRGGRAPGVGDLFDGFYIWANGRSNLQSLTFFTASQDRLPDSGVLPTSWSVLDGLVSSGHLQAHSDRPVRVSNGEATTFLFEVDITNTGTFVDYAIPSWEGGQEGWIVTFPEGKVRLAPGETKTIPFLVTVPFAHQHGSYHPFIVTLQSQADPLAAGKLELGVRYTAIPQPAGHHPSVYLHQLRFDYFFNTIEGDNFPEATTEDESGDVSGANSYTCGNPGDAYGEAYSIPLSPRLEMGVDFDLDALGEAIIMSTSEQGAEGVWYDGWVIVDTKRPGSCDHRFGNTPDGIVARIEPSEVVDIAAGGSEVTKSVITPLPAGDYVPYEDGLQMWFMIVQHRDGIAPNDLLCCLANEFEAVLMPETELFLPLSEYHDDVDDFFHRLTGIDLYATTPQERMVNPGEVVLFRLSAQNIGVTEAEFTLQLTGANKEWASLLGGVTKLKLKPGDSQQLVVAVRAPASASDGDLADITMVMSHKEDDTVRSIIRFLAEVDQDADHADEALDAELLNGELKQAPGLGWLPLVGMLAVASVLLRRRQ